jgi:hypothetical protein
MAYMFHFLSINGFDIPASGSQRTSPARSPPCSCLSNSGDEHAMNSRQQLTTIWSIVLFNALRYIIMAVPAWVTRVHHLHVSSVGANEHNRALLDPSV